MRYVIYPIHIASTKPLTPTHVRHLLYVDCLYRGLKAKGADVVYPYNRLRMDVTPQVLKLEQYIESKQLSVTNAEEVGGAYVQMTNEGYALSQGRISEMRKEREESLSGNSYYKSILPEWVEQHNFLRMHDPGLTQAEPFKLSLEGVIEKLKGISMILDSRKQGENVYIDLTDEGIKLRHLCSSVLSDYNYLGTMLRELLALRKEGDVFVFIFDDELLGDFFILQRVLEKLGHKVYKIQTNRILLEGKALSSRHGGWEKYSLGRVLAFLQDKGYTQDEIALGLRFYYLGFIPKSFEYRDLEKYTQKARFVLKRVGRSRETLNTEIPFPHKKFDGTFVSPPWVAQMIMKNRMFDVTEQQSLLYNLFL